MSDTCTDTELSKALVNSLLRDFFAAFAAAGINAAVGETDTAVPMAVAKISFAQADALLAESHTPKIIEQLKHL